MSDTSAFDGIADTYARYRPGYPPAILSALWDYALEHPAALREAPRAVDVGAGTGISTAALRASAPADIEVIALEPGRDMRLEAERRLAGVGGVAVIAGRAESLPFADASVGLVLAAQAVQWFDRPAFYAEAIRVLHAGGTLALLQNNRSWQSSALLASYENFLETHNPSYSRYYRDFDLTRELASLARLADTRTVRASWTRTMASADFLQMTLSSTKMREVLTQYGKSQAIAMLTDALGASAANEPVTLPYLTELFLARRR